MEDAVANYEHTKRTTPIPAGWMLVEAEDPRCKPTEVPVKFWNSALQTWEDLTIDANGAPAVFNTLWQGGATCLVIKDPNFVPAPPPAFAPPSPSLPFAAPTPMAAPFAAPVAPPVTPAIPAQVPVAIPVAAPVAVPAVPVMPLPVLPMPVAPAIPVAAPVAATNGLPFPTPAVAQAIPAAPTEEYEIPESTAPFSAADPNEVYAWWAAREGVLDKMEALKKVEGELRKRIVKTCFPDGLREGSNKCKLPEGEVLTITGVINRKIDQALVVDVQSALQKKNGVAPTGLFKTKYDLDLRTYKALPSEDKLVLANCVTETEGSPQLALKDAK